MRHVVALQPCNTLHSKHFVYFCLQIQIKGMRCLFQDLMDTMESMKKAVRVLGSEAISSQIDDMRHSLHVLGQQ